MGKPSAPSAPTQVSNDTRIPPKGIWSDCLETANSRQAYTVLQYVNQMIVRQGTDLQLRTPRESANDTRGRSKALAAGQYNPWLSNGRVNAPTLGQQTVHEC